ncbi:histone deacetylase family protein [Achromobacter pestifer]|uniref:Histone deacetylase family protein n=1 Tax=Achromobacter pestifer TaxID=1353889 RepID=A0A7D4E294_9BURK|nr:histone deacetylase family protein [Achromobacter pestifer]QKH34486.1 histone deacetylase family protein [Achromobacter pestifer]
MKALLSPLHDADWTGNALVRGILKPHHDARGRGREIEAALRDAGLDCQTVGPLAQGVPELTQIHTPGYLAYLQSAWTEWRKAPDASFEVRPNIWPNRHYPDMRASTPVAMAGRYLADGATPIVEDTWRNVYASAETAVAAAQAVLDGSSSVYALVRPSGHHAMSDMGMGGCLLANTALAAQRLAGQWGRVAILDIDVHHGNGTQQIFYGRDDVLTISIHGDPASIYPFSSGYGEETGKDAGEGYNLNLPLAAGTEIAGYLKAFEPALERIEQFKPRALVVATGYDTFRGDAFGNLSLDTPDYALLGRRIAQLGLPTLFVQEGGYAIDALRANTRSMLEGYLGHARR